MLLCAKLKMDVFVFFMMPLVFIMQSDGQMDKALDCAWRGNGSNVTLNIL
jgi:hypothetical protein